ncbi:glycosyltransferase family 2 protein [Alteromonas stellipolaris]|uniref:glycosyltransferase family 2 protein n=1 Tax=Alteromonas stellipolaris TaxID=233316 RepID=UPI002118A3B1|nr:glycosyltransferase family 2 protein [Alteromonas stellipolaris]MCQ8847328.1 glycosyltransferase family 2 protein [Alteromonas stellipolaris]
MQKGDCIYVAAIIVNYGTANLTTKAVQSLLDIDNKNIELTIFVVDNHSPSDDVTILKNAQSLWGDNVEIWPLNENKGFGGGNNVVLEHLSTSEVKPEYVFFLNPDAFLHNDVVTILAEKLDSDSSIATAGALVLREGTNQPVVSSFRFPSFLNECVKTLAVGPISRLFESKSVPIPPSENAAFADWVTGAAFLTRFSVLEEVGFFDPAFFLYYEEAELMHRIKESGYKVWFEPKAKVIHAAGAATGMKDGKHQENKQPIYIYDSWRIYFVKTYGIWGARLLSVLNLMLAVVNVSLTKITSKKKSLPKDYLNQFWHYSLKPLFSTDTTKRHFPVQKRLDKIE